MTPTWLQCSFTDLLRAASRHALLDWTPERNLLPSLIQWAGERYRELAETFDWPETSAAVECAYEAGFWNDAVALTAMTAEERAAHLYYHEGQYWWPAVDTAILAGDVPGVSVKWEEAETIQQRVRLDGPAADPAARAFPTATLPQGARIFGVYRTDPASHPARAGRGLRHRLYASGWLQIVEPCPGTVWVHHCPPAPDIASLVEWDADTTYDFSELGPILVWASGAEMDGKLYRLKADSTAGTVPADGETWELVPLPRRLADIVARFVAADHVANQEGDTPRAQSHKRRAEQLLDTELEKLASTLK